MAGVSPMTCGFSKPDPQNPRHHKVMWKGLSEAEGVALFQEYSLMQVPRPDRVAHFLQLLESGR